MVKEGVFHKEEKLNISSLYEKTHPLTIYHKDRHGRGAPMNHASSYPFGDPFGDLWGSLLESLSGIPFRDLSGIPFGDLFWGSFWGIPSDPSKMKHLLGKSG